MTEIEARTRPLSEVWERFNEINDFVEIFGKIRATDPECAFIEEQPMLRSALLERCADVSDQYRNWPPATIEKQIEHNKHMAAVHLFWAWELEQRKEAQNG